MKSMNIVSVALMAVLSGCATMPPPPPQWNPVSEAAEAEYRPYFEEGSGSITGQAFLAQRGGGVVKAAGRTVSLDPATSIGNEWWGKAGKFWVHRSLTSPSPGFAKARRTTVADADGRFKFSGLPVGKYYVRTEVTWEIGGYNSTQGGLVGQLVEIRDGQTVDVILNNFPQ
jgi:hypothetical protein